MSSSEPPSPVKREPAERECSSLRHFAGSYKKGGRGPQNDPNAPLSLAPGRQQGATRTASAPASQPMPTSGGGGAYAVQVTSQRTEAEAQSSYQALQAKYPNVLGNRQAMIRRADLGDKGTYYRAQVPFGTQGEASEFCASLKAAGGQCVVQRN